MKQRQITKKDIKNKVLHDFLFGQTSNFPVTICEFIADNFFFNHTYIPKQARFYLINEEDFSTKYISDKVVMFNDTISVSNENDIFGHVLLNENKDSNEEEILIESTQIITIKGSDGSETEKKFNSIGKFPFNFDKVLVNVVFIGSFYTPVVRIFEIKGDMVELESQPIVGVDCIFSEKYPNYLSLIYDSTKQKITYNEKVIKANNTIMPPMEKLKNKVEGLYSLSSISKETVKYDEDGDVIEYENSYNRIKSKTIYLSKSDPVNVRKEVYFCDKLIYFSEISSTKDEIVSKDSFGNVHITSSGDKKPLGECDFYEFLDENRVTGQRKMRRIKSEDLNSSSKFYNIEDISNEPWFPTTLNFKRITDPIAEGFPNNPYLYMENSKDFKYGIFYYNEDKISINIYIVQNELTERIYYMSMTGFYNGEQCINFLMNSLSTKIMNEETLRFYENFHSISGIQFNAIYDCDKILLEYKDNDIYAKNYLNHTEVNSETINCNESCYYARDMFGVPYKMEKIHEENGLV